MESKLNEKKMTSNRYFIFLRSKDTINCDALVYWKPIQQGGCFVGKLKEEKEAIYAAKKIFNKRMDQAEEDKKPLSFHIVDMDYHSIIITGDGKRIKDLRKNREMLGVPEELDHIEITYEKNDIKVKYVGKDPEE